MRVEQNILSYRYQLNEVKSQNDTDSVIKDLNQNIKLLNNQEKINSLSNKIKDLRRISREMGRNEQTIDKSDLSIEFKRQASTIKNLIGEYRKEMQKINNNYGSIDLLV